MVLKSPLAAVAFLWESMKWRSLLLTEPWLRFPVVCPACRREELTALPIAGVAAALLNGSAIPLHVSCHDFYWHASLIEIEQLREYLIVAGIGIDRIKREGITKEKAARRRPIR